MMIVNKLVLNGKKIPLLLKYLSSSSGCWNQFYCNLQMTMVKRKKDGRI